MAKVKQRAFNHSGLLFLILIFVIFIVINCVPFLLKKESPNIIFNGQEEVYIASKLPITDASAKDLNVDDIQDGIIGYSEFTIELEEEFSEDVEYEIYLTDVTDTDVFKYDYVKVYLTDEDGTAYKQFGGNNTPSYRDMRVSLNAPSKRILLSDKISAGEVKKFKLRIWVADTYVLDIEEKEFRGKISVKTILRRKNE